jgi:branched-chain amino acid transport system permease protein
VTSGYTAQITAILVANIVTAYAAYVPLTCVPLDLGMSGFMAVGVYTSAFVSGHGAPSGLSIPVFSGVSSPGTCSAPANRSKEVSALGR